MATLMSNRQVKTGTLAAMGQSWERFQNTKTQNTNCNMSINLFQWDISARWDNSTFESSCIWTSGPQHAFCRKSLPPLGLELICLARVAGQQDQRMTCVYLRNAGAPAALQGALRHPASTGGFPRALCYKHWFPEPSPQTWEILLSTL